MIRYLSMDLRRLFKTRSFYTAMIVAVIFLAIFALAAYFVTGIAQDVMPGSERLINEQMMNRARAQMTFNFFFSFFFSLPGMRMLHVLLALFASGFLSREHHTGYIKNLLSLPRMRSKWMLSKTLTMLLATLVFYAVFAGACALVLVLYRNPLVIRLSEFGPYVLGQILVDMALYAVIMLGVILFQSKAASVVIALLLSLNVQGLFYLLIDWMGLLPFRLGTYGMMNLAARSRMPGSISSLMGETGMSILSSSSAVSADPVLLWQMGGGVLVLFLLLSALALWRVDYKG